MFKVGDKVRVRLECLGIDEYRNQSGKVTCIDPFSRQGIYIEFDNEHVIAAFGFYEHELELI